MKPLVMIAGSRPLVSLVTPSYNQVDFLEATIRSVLAQDYAPIEYILIDGGSTDGSVEVIRRYTDRLAWWVSEPDRGQAHAINKGLQRAKGSILGWLNSDDTLLPGAVRRVVAAMPDHPAVVHGSVLLVDEGGEPIVRPKLGKRRRPFNLQNVVDDGLVNQPGAFWNRGAMEQAGLLDEGLKYVIDYELWVRMALAGVTFIRLDDPPLATYRLTRGTKTIAGMGQMGLEQLAVFDRLLANPNLAATMGITQAELERRARRARGLACLKVARGYARMPGQRRQAWRWFRRAFRLYPPGLMLFPEYLLKQAYVSLSYRLGKAPPTW